MFALVIGGAGSGKSEYAEDLAVKLGYSNKIYIATMLAYDNESIRRIQKHQKQRANKHFITIECPRDLENCQIGEGSTVLLECMSNIVANEMYTEEGIATVEEVFSKIAKGIEHLEKTAEHIVIVSNQVFSDGKEYDESTKEYLKALSRLNQFIAIRATDVVEVVSGIPIVHKGENL